MTREFKGIGHRRRRRGAGMEELGIVMILLVIVTLGTVQLGLFVRDQMRLERTSQQIASLAAETTAKQALTADMETVLADVVTRAGGLSSTDYGLRLRQIRLDTDPAASVTYWTRTYGGIAPPPAQSADELRSAQASDDEVVIALEMTARITGASLLFESIDLGRTRRVLHLRAQPSHTYAAWDPNASAAGLSLSGGVEVADADDADETAYATVAPTEGRRYFEVKLDAGDVIQVGWDPTPDGTPYDERIALEGFGVNADLGAGTLAWHDAASGYQTVATGVSPGDVVGVAVDLGTGAVAVYHGAAGGCTRVLDATLAAPSQLTPAVTLGARGGNAANRVTARFGSTDFDCKPAGYEGARTID